MRLGQEVISVLIPFCRECGISAGMELVLVLCFAEAYLCIIVYY